MNNEPVAWMSAVNGETVYVGYEPAEGWLAIPLYTHPVKELDEDFDAICLENKRLQAEIEALKDKLDEAEQRYWNNK